MQEQILDAMNLKKREFVDNKWTPDFAMFISFFGLLSFCWSAIMSQKFF